MTMALDKHRTRKEGRRVEAAEVNCACRPCWRPHDCGQRTTMGEWLPRMACATWFGGNCRLNGRNPDTNPPQPAHDFGKARRHCKRCGAIRMKEAA